MKESAPIGAGDGTAKIVNEDTVRKEAALQIKRDLMDLSLTESDRTKIEAKTNQLLNNADSARYRYRKEIADIVKYMDILKAEAAEHGFDIENDKELVLKDPKQESSAEQKELMELKADWARKSAAKKKLEEKINIQNDFLKYKN